MTRALPVLAGPSLPAVGADPWVPTPYEVVRVRRDTADTFTLALRLKAGGPAMAFAPGQFNMLYAFGVGESAISVSGDPHRREVLQHTIRNVGAVTAQLARLRRGDTLLLRGPYGRPWPIAELAGRDVLVVAGGIGLAPLRPVLMHLLRYRKKYGRIAVVYGARTPADLLFAADLKRLSEHGAAQVEITVDHATADWSGDVGVVTALLGRVAVDPARATALVCGPEIMMHYVRLELKKRGLADAQIYLTMERNMKCAIGHCGHCQLGPKFICKDGPVFSFDQLDGLFGKKEL
jgi:NAD(P)H-flavin reductase